MSDGMRRELVYLSSYATNRYFIPNWGNIAVEVAASEEAGVNQTYKHQQYG